MEKAPIINELVTVQNLEAAGVDPAQAQAHARAHAATAEATRHGLATEKYILKTALAQCVFAITLAGVAVTLTQIDIGGGAGTPPMPGGTERADLQPTEHGDAGTQNAAPESLTGIVQRVSSPCSEGTAALGLHGPRFGTPPLCKYALVPTVPDLPGTGNTALNPRF